MRTKLIGLLSAMVVATIAMGPARAAEGDGPKQPDVLVVTFHADWCGTCEQLKEPMAGTVKRVADAPVLFVTLDLTNDETQAQAEMLAAALGLEDVWTEYSRGTGFVVLVDRESGEVVDRLTTKQSADEMVAKVNTALARARR